RGDGGGHGLGEHAGARLADDQRPEDGRQEPDARDGRAGRPEPGEEVVGTGPEPVPCVEDDAEGDGEDGGDNDVNGPPAVAVHGWASRLGDPEKTHATPGI